MPLQVVTKGAFILDEGNECVLASPNSRVDPNAEITHLRTWLICLNMTDENGEKECIPWLEIKKSALKDAGYGLFAAQDFRPWDLIGIYTGCVSNVLPSDTTYCMKVGQDTSPCYINARRGVVEYRSTSNSSCQATFGLQFVNDPSFNRSENTLVMPNAHLSAGGEVFATKNIKAGEEIYFSYPV